MGYKINRAKCKSSQRNEGSKSCARLWKEETASAKALGQV